MAHGDERWSDELMTGTDVSITVRRTGQHLYRQNRPKYQAQQYSMITGAVQMACVTYAMINLPIPLVTLCHVAACE